MIKRIVKFVGAFLAVETGLYPCIYFIIDRRFGLLHSKSDAVLSSLWWNIGFYSHIIPGGLALLIGWLQFNSRLRKNHLKVHRLVGRTYVISALISSLAAIYIAFYARGGIIATLGFVSLGIVWFSTTLKAYLLIRSRRVDDHQKMMVFSYAACFAAVTLRIYLPLLDRIFRDEITAYLVVSWLCWIPNIIVAFILTRRLPPSTSPYPASS